MKRHAWVSLKDNEVTEKANAASINRAVPILSTTE